MTRRRILLIGSTVCLLAAVPFVARWATTPAPGMTLENFQRLHEGMTLDQIQAILGRPPHRTIYSSPYNAHFDDWHGTDANIKILRDGKDPINAKASEGYFSPRGSEDELTLLKSAPKGIFATVRRWLGI